MARDVDPGMAGDVDPGMARHTHDFFLDVSDIRWSQLRAIWRRLAKSISLCLSHSLNLNFLNLNYYDNEM